MDKYTSVMAFRNYLYTFPITSILLPGNIYSFLYRFDQQKDFKKIQKDVSKFYDYFPIVFIVEGDQSHIRGFNMHQLPVYAREMFLQRLNMFINNEDGQRLFFAEFPKLKRMFLKASFSYRQYDLHFAQRFRAIPFDDWQETIQYAARTYFNSNVNQVEQVYRKFIPKI